MTAFDNVRRKRTTVMLAAGLAVLVAVAGLGYMGVKALRRYEGATKVGSDAIRIPPTPVGMLATVDAENRLTSISVMVLSPNAAPGGSILSLPVSGDSTLMLGPDRIPFSEVFATGGIDELALSVESALSVTLEVYQVADPAATETLLQPVGQVSATLTNAVAEDIPAGAATLTAAQVVQVLNHTEEGQVDRARRGNVEAVWAGVAAAVGPGLAGATDATTTSAVTGGSAAPITFGSFPELFTRLVSGPVGARALPADLIDAAMNPAGKDVESLDRAECVMVLASIAPRSMSQPAPGLVYRIEAPAGYEAQMRVAVALVLLGGGNVQSVYLNGPVRETTLILVDDERLKDEADSEGVFGAWEAAKPDSPIEGIDIIIQLGTEWLDAPPSVNTSTSTTVAAGDTTVPADSTVPTESTTSP